MKIKSILVENIPPIKKFQVDDLSDIVIIAGANGSGKSNLKQAIINTFNNPTSPQVDISITSTRMEEEQEKWGSRQLDVVRETNNAAFSSYMNSRTRGGSYTGTVIQIDSQRSITGVQFQQINLSTPDPDDVETDYRWYLNPFNNRWQEIVNKIFQKSANRDSKIAQYNKENPNGRIADALAHYPDSFIKYQELFAKLLPGNTLEPIDPKNLRDFNYKTTNNTVLSFSSLSSGEQEVIKITFDLLSKRMTHCVFLIDEPELHLHPTLTFRLIETLKEIGGGTNQFIFFTHSADLISTYYTTGNVYFIDATKDGQNEARKLSELDVRHENLAQTMSENLGLFAVGKKIIFVEGEHSSRDRLTYHTISQKYFPQAYISPAGSVGDIRALNKLAQEIQNKIFGVDFFIIRDRDGLTDDNIRDLEANSKIKCLKKRCLENYFLDAEMLAKVADRFCIQDATLHNPTDVGTKLKEIANEFFNYNLLLVVKEYVNLRAGMEVPTVKDVHLKSISDIKQEFVAALEVSLTHHQEQLKSTEVLQMLSDEHQKLTSALNNDTWKDIFSGKEIFEMYCGSGYLKIDALSARQAYVEIALIEKPEVFQDIIDIMDYFENL